MPPDPTHMGSQNIKLGVQGPGQGPDSTARRPGSCASGHRVSAASRAWRRWRVSPQMHVPPEPQAETSQGNRVFADELS